MKIGSAEIQSALELPKLTTAERDASTQPEASLIYNTTTRQINCKEASGWSELVKRIEVSSAVTDTEWNVDQVYTQSISVPGLVFGTEYSISPSVSSDFLAAITQEGKLLVINAWCSANDTLTVSAKIV